MKNNEASWERALSIRMANWYELDDASTTAKDGTGILWSNVV
jgi:hypothetical protein